MPETGSPSLIRAGRPERAIPVQAAWPAAMLAAAFGCLQPAIDPVFLTLLSEAGPVPLGAHGLIVGGTQAGAAIGALGVWRFGHRLPGGVFLTAAALACLASLLTATSIALVPVFLLRFGYGAAMGMVFARAMGLCAAQRPNGAYGGMFVLQLLLATLVSLALPALAAALGPRAALALLSLAPAAAGGALMLTERGTMAAGQLAELKSPEPAARVPPAGWALAAATFCFVAGTMLVWSFAGALAAEAGIAESVIGEAVALGSLVGAATALAVMRERVILPLPATALLAAFMLASPVLLTASGKPFPFIVSMIFLNIGSTAMIVRCSGLATATSRDARFRTLVACTHSLGMIAGPAAGSALIAGFGNHGLLGGVTVILAAGLLAVLFAAKRGVGRGTLLAGPRQKFSSPNSRQSA